MPLAVSEIVHSEHTEASIKQLDSGAEYQARRSQPLVSMTMRAELDAKLVEAAKDAGVQVHESTEITALESMDHCVELSTEAAPINRPTLTGCRAG